MNVKTVFILLWVCLIMPPIARAQGFADLGTSAQGFAVPQPDYKLRFPSDHGAHPAFRIEWWYLTANLTGPDQTEYGLQWTLFRTVLSQTSLLQAEDSGWNNGQLWMGHAAVTSPTAHFTAERLARGGIGQAGVTAVPFEAWIDDWVLEGTGSKTPLGAATLRASGIEFAYDMQLQARGPWVLHGQEGYSVKSADGRASHYYSQPFFDISGTLRLPQGVVPVTGQAWLDREWSSSPLAVSQTGWDWFSLSFADGDKLMAFQVRDQAGRAFTSATWITANGRTTSFGNGALTVTPMHLTSVAGRKVPTQWRLQLEDKGLDIRIDALNPSAWMDVSLPSGEGPVRFTGTHTGRGYLEMTGYE
jgi:predicted secreted hydrolase